MKHRSLLSVGIAALALSALAVPAWAQQRDSLRDAWTLPYPEELPVMEVARIRPGNSLGSAVAFGAPWGAMYTGVSYQHRARRATRDDGAAFVGFGFGDAREWVGLDVSVAALGTVRSFGRFGLTVRAHRHLPGRSAIAVGIENAAVIGFTDSPRSTYAVASKEFTFRDSPNAWFRSLTASLGAGNGRYVFEEDFREGRFDKVNMFGSVGLHVAEPVTVVADWTGPDLALGLSIVPFKRIPLVISPALVDVTGMAGDGARFVLTAGAGLYIPNFLPRR